MRRHRLMENTCAICGDVVRSEIAPHWHPGQQLRRAHRDMQTHMKSHSFAEVLRFEIRQDLDQVPEDERPSIVRDVYRSLLGTTSEGVFTLGDDDARGAYTIEDALGSSAMYRLWWSHNACGLPGCEQHAV